MIFDCFCCIIWKIFIVILQKKWYDRSFWLFLFLYLASPNELILGLFMKMHGCAIICPCLFIRSHFIWYICIPSHRLFALSQVASSSPGCPCGSMFSWGISCEESARLQCSLWESHTSMITLWRRTQPSTSVHLHVCSCVYDWTGYRSDMHLLLHGLPCIQTESQAVLPWY